MSNTEQFQNQIAPTAVLVEPIGATDTSCVVSNPSNFNILTAGQQFQMSLQDTPNSAIEIVMVTATNGPLFTIQRGAIALTHISGAAAAQVVTAKQFAAMYPNGGIKSAGGPYSFDGSLPIMEITNNTPAATAITITTANLVPFRIYTIADGAGVAAADHITITPDTGLINGSANYIISTNNGFLQFYWNGIGCRII